MLDNSTFPLLYLQNIQCIIGSLLKQLPKEDGKVVIQNSKNLDSYPVWTERKTFPLQNKEN